MKSQNSTTRVWDAPTRLFHWALVGLFAFSWWSAENGEMEWHLLSGTAMLGLILFRLVWGVIGGSTARFSGILRSPVAALEYVRGKAPPRAGHNPLGGYSVIAMLLLLVTQVGTGLFAVDVDGIESGPLSPLVSFDQGRQASAIHELSFNLLLALIGLHILTIIFYRVARRRNLVIPMITGSDAELPSGTRPLAPAPVWRFVVAAAAAAGVAWWTGQGLGL